MSKLLGRENVGVKSTDLKDGYIPRWNTSSNSWETVYFENQIEGLYSLDFDIPFLVADSQYSRIALDPAKIYLDNDGVEGDIGFTAFGSAYLEDAPTSDLTLEVHRVYNNGSTDDIIANIFFAAGEKTGVFKHPSTDNPPAVLNFNKGDRFYIKTPSDLYGASNLSVSIRTAILLPLGSSSPRIVLLDDQNAVFNSFNTFSYTFDSNTLGNASETTDDLSDTNLVQSFYLSASGLSTASDGVTISFQNGNFEVSNTGEWRDSLVIPQVGGSIESTQIYVRPKAGIVTYDAYEDFGSHSTQTTKTIPDSIKISQEEVASQSLSLNFVATIPAIYDSNNFVLKIKSDENGAFGISNLSGVSSFTYRKFSKLFEPINVTSSQINVTNAVENTDYLLEIPGLTKMTGNSSILDVFNFGTNLLGSNLSGFFNETKIVTFKATNAPVLTNVTNMSSFFENASDFNDPIINNWDISNVDNISKMFSGASSFNQPLPNWDLNANIEAVDPIFGQSNMSQLNVDLTLTGWANKAISNNRTFTSINNLNLGVSLSTSDVSENINYNNHGLTVAEQVKSSLNAALEFADRDLTIEIPSSNANIQLAENGVTIFAADGTEDGSYSDINGTRYYVFVDANTIDEDNAEVAVTSLIEDMSELFDGQTTFNKDISHWDVSNVTNFYRMFRNCSSFNQDLRYWNVSSATNFESMFNGASAFNCDISFWYNNKPGAVNVNFISSSFPEYKKPIFTGVNTNALEEGNTYEHEGTNYSIVKSPYTGRIWFGEDLKNGNSYFYQWGRSTDGHQNRDSVVSNTQIGFSDTSNEFIVNNNNWANSDNNNLWNKEGVDITNNISPKNWSPFRVEDIEDEIVGLLNNNIIRYSENFSNDAWVKTEGVSIATSSLEGVLDYNVTSSSITNNDSIFSIKQSLYVNGFSNYVLSFYFKNDNNFSLSVKNSGGTAIDNGNQLDSSIVEGTNWKRFSLNFFTGNNEFIEIDISSTELNIFGVQLEEVDSSISTATPYVYKEDYKEVTTTMLERSFLKMTNLGYRNKSDGIVKNTGLNYWLLNYNGNNDSSSKYFSVPQEGTSTFGIGSSARSYGYSVRLVKENDYLLPYNIFVYKQQIVKESGYIAVLGRDEQVYIDKPDFENFNLVCTFNAGNENKLYALNTKEEELEPQII